MWDDPEKHAVRVRGKCVQCAGPLYKDNKPALDQLLSQSLFVFDWLQVASCASKGSLNGFLFLLSSHKSKALMLLHRICELDPEQFLDDDLFVPSLIGVSLTDCDSRVVSAALCFAEDFVVVRMHPAVQQGVLTGSYLEHEFPFVHHSCQLLLNVWINGNFSKSFFFFLVFFGLLLDWRAIACSLRL